MMDWPIELVEDLGLPTNYSEFPSSLRIND
jgi:hypothetical protein